MVLRICAAEDPFGLRAKATLSVLLDTLRQRQQPSPFHEAGSLAPLVVATVLSSQQLQRLRANLAPLRIPSGVRAPVGCS